MARASRLPHRALEDRIQSAGNVARLTFDNSHAWLVARPLELEQARRELAELVIAERAEDPGFDV